jgi:hypothetical protein
VTRCPAHAELALAVAADLGCAIDGSDALIGELAASLEPGDADTELQAVRARCETFGRGPALLLPEVLRARAGDPAGVALAVAAAAQRAGMAIDVVGHGDTLLLAHPDAPMVVEPSGRLLDGRTLGVDLEWRCAHETAATLLDRISERAERTGDLALATAARALTLTLPLEDDSRSYRVREHARLLSRLN